jgi:bifunctional ADP-heptose synthase (sugar kinase/adenylyltransferase)
VTFEPLEGRRADDGPGDAWRSRVKSEHVPALSPHVVDALGCGDALLATATLAMASGGSLLSAAYLGTVAASVHGSRMGNVPVDIATLRRRTELLGANALSFVPAEVLAARGVSRVTPVAS